MTRASTWLFTAVALGVVVPLLAPGFVFLPDMVWSPRPDWADFLHGGVSIYFPVDAALALLGRVLPSEWVQKLLLFGALLLPGVAMERLARPYVGRAYAFGAGLLYQCNPYVFERFAAGQWRVLLGYGLFPLVISFCVPLLRQFDRRRALMCMALLTAYPFLSLHWAAITAVFLLALAAAALSGLVPSPSSRRLAAVCIALVVILALAPIALSLFQEGALLARIGPQDFAAFDTRSDPRFGVWFNVLSLYGMWRADDLLPKHLLPWWWLVTPLLLALSAWGAAVLVRRRDALGTVTAIAFFPVLVLAVGYASPWTRPLVERLAAHLPLAAGFRDTAKLVGLIAFAYAFFLPITLSSLRSPVGRRAGVAFTVLLPFLIAGPLLWGASGQLRTAAYPASWEAAETLLAAEPESRALFLPWKPYLRLNFAGDALVVNPALVYFSVPVVAAAATGNPRLVRTEAEPWGASVADLLLGSETASRTAVFWREQGITHVLLAKTDDWEASASALAGLRLAVQLETPDMIVYALR